MRKTVLGGAAGLLLMLSWPRAVAAQSEQALKDYFESRTVIVKLDMPGMSRSACNNSRGGVTLRALQDRCPSG